jgi:outer membrane immunogenic protein
MCVVVSVGAVMLRNLSRLALVAFGVVVATVVVGASAGKAQNGPVYNWSGFYLGVEFGGGFGDNPWSNPDDGFLGRTPLAGVIFAGGAGYNFQFGQMVFGIEAYVAHSSVQGEFRKFGWDFAGRLESYESVTGRVGFTSGADGGALYYARGGVAWAQYRFTSDWPEIQTFFEANRTLTGWAVGLGYERAISADWRIKAEFTHFNFGSSTADLMPNRPGIPSYRVDLDNWSVNKLSVGVNYRLGEPWAPVMRAQRVFIP